MITIRPATPADSAPIGAVHVAAWRSAYAGILPSGYLAGLSALRNAKMYDGAIRAGGCVIVAAIGERVIGFTTASRSRRDKLADGEIETLYVLDDYRDQGAGRGLLRAAASWLAGHGCGSAFLWVLRDNPSRWFYERLGGRPVARGNVPVAGQAVPQVAYAWDPLAQLLQKRSADSD